MYCSIYFKFQLKKKINLSHIWWLGKWTGFVSTPRLTHATPAALYAHVADRDWESDSDQVEAGMTLEERNKCPDIARHLVDNKDTSNIKVEFCIILCSSLPGVGYVMRY